MNVLRATWGFWRQGTEAVVKMDEIGFNEFNYYMGFRRLTSVCGSFILQDSKYRQRTVPAYVLPVNSSGRTKRPNRADHNMTCRSFVAIFRLLVLFPQPRRLGGRSNYTARSVNQDRKGSIVDGKAFVSSRRSRTVFARRRGGGVLGMRRASRRQTRLEEGMKDDWRVLWTDSPVFGTSHYLGVR